jgi:hypothetical protein
MNFTMLISELSEEDRQAVEHWVELLPKAFRRCEVYLRDYKEDTQNVLKLLQEMDTTSMMIAEARSDLIERHRIPDYPEAS